jgi:hypothetical protein
MAFLPKSLPAWRVPLPESTLATLRAVPLAGWHLLGWGLYLILTTFGDYAFGSVFSWRVEGFMLLTTITVFYFNLKTSFQLLEEQRFVLAVVTTLALWLTVSMLKAVTFAVLVKAGVFPPYFDGADVIARLNEKAGPEGRSAYYNAGRITGYVLARILGQEAYPLLISFIYGYGRSTVRYQRRLRELTLQRQRERERQQELENEVTHARLQALKYQINPHFLFNSLNFLYAQALPLSDPLARGTLLLSEIMRYGLQENSDEAKVPLEQEVRHLQNFVAFNQLRFANRLHVRFTVEGNTAFRRIMPLLLITFVENAFKYGELHDAQYPLDIRLVVDTERLLFRVYNKKRSGPKEHSTGIGLDNIRKRLELAYPQRHTLTITDEPTTYTAELTITL